MINPLDKKFAYVLQELLINCKNRGVIMVPFEGLRTPQMQAVYWVQGRTELEIKKAIAKLKENRAYFLASCLEYASPKGGRIITKALPGCSWHQWGEAVDCYWLYKNLKIWKIDTKSKLGYNGYEVYAEEAERLGLNAGYYWENFIDACHVQLKKEASPLKLYTFKEIDGVMKSFYSRKFD